MGAEIIETISRGRPTKAKSLKPIAPFERDSAKAAASAFDREGGGAVPADEFKTYAEALALFHLSAEDKFENGAPWDRGTTQRRHVVCIPRLQLIVLDGDKEIELVPNLVLENGGDLYIKPTTKVHEFPVGSTIQFSADDFGEIAFACWMMAGELVSKLPKPPGGAQNSSNRNPNE